MLREALQLVEERGWRVLPIHPHSKKPLIPTGVHGGTSCPSQVRRWWWKNPDANLGVVCDGFWVMDVDPLAGGNRSFDRMGNPSSSLQVLTARHGRHHYFAHDTRLDSIPLGRVLPGLDVKGSGRHYVVAPPSRIGHSKYRWLGDRMSKLEPAPNSVVEQIVKLKTPAPPQVIPYSGILPSRVLRYLSKMEPAIQGQGGSRALWRVARKLRVDFGMGEEMSWLLIQEWNSRCLPPWSEPEIRRALGRAVTRSVNKERASGT